MAENLQLYWVVRFFHPRSSWTTHHLMLFSERPLSVDKMRECGTEYI